MAAVIPFVIAGLQIVGGIQKGRAAEAQAEGQARQQEFNARIAAENAQTVKGQTQAQLEKADRERRIRVGANIAAGQAAGTGGSLDILQSSAAQEELNLLTIKSEGLLKEREFGIEESLGRASAFNIRQQGKASKAAAVLGGVSKGVSTATGAF